MRPGRPRLPRAAPADAALGHDTRSAHARPPSAFAPNSLELLKSGKATEKALIDWALINGCEIVGGGLHINSKYGGIDCSTKISQLQQKVAKICSQKIGQNDKSSALILGDKSALIQIGQCVLGQLRLDEKQIIQNALANGQNAKQKVALFEFGALIKAFLNELPEEQAKSALVKLLASKQQVLPSDLIDMLLNKLSFIAADRGRIGTEKSENPKKCSENSSTNRKEWKLRQQTIAMKILVTPNRDGDD
ncbi:hypothetical protein GPALN_002109 [Globodera pallida]|nr:hypothetical protein GPALN_002109 [Globodera pallida]